MACEHPTNGDSSSSILNPLNNEYRRFFENFQKTVNPLDPLPVKVGSHSIRENEVDGEIIDWTLNLLQQKNCPSKLLAHLISLILWEVKFCISKEDADKEISRERGFEPVKLMQLVTSKINNICLDYLNNQKFENLCTELSFSNKALHPVSVHAIRNGRRKMEDRHVVIQDLNTICSLRDDVPSAYYAVFDGHAGTDAAFYAASQLHMKLVRNSKYTTDPGQALKEAFLATDHAFVFEHEHERLKGGTTAVAVLIRGNLLLTAWLGDSQAVLVREGVATHLVNPHKPDRSDEKQRISDLGGEVIFWDGAFRVNGQLAVSRAIGDASYKPYVTSEPDLVALQLEGNEDFLIIGCDGLWDTVSHDEASFIVLQFLHHETDISGLSGRLVQAAKQKGSSDNISVIVVFLRDPEVIARRPLPPAPSTSPPPQAGLTMEEQQEEYDKLTAKWGWSEPQGGAAFNESSWQQDPDGPQPQNPFGNGDDEASGLHNPTDEELEAKWGWSEPEISSTTPQLLDPSVTAQHAWKDPEIEALEREARQELEADNQPFHGGGYDSTHHEQGEEERLAQWGWKESEPAAADSTTGLPVHFVATSIQPFDDQIHPSNDGAEEKGALAVNLDWKDSEASKLVHADPEEVRREYEKVAAKWDRDLENFGCNNSADTSNVQNDQPKSDFHLSSDGSTWDQTSGTPQPSGVDWNQYDEDMSGQPSLIFLGQSDTAADSAEQHVASAVQEVGAMNGLPETAMNSDHQMWASEENSVAFPSAAIPATTAADAMLIDEGIAGDEADFASSGALLVESSPPDVVSTTSAAPQPGDPDFHWNLHAPEFEFRAKESSPLAEEVSGERKLSATVELLVRSSNDAELAVLLAAANDDPDETELQEDQGLELDPLSPRDSRPLYESKNDGTVEGDDSEDDWTFNDYRSGGAEQSKEESVDTSSVMEADADTKAVESCSQRDCEANNLGDQLGRLTVDEQIQSAPAPEVNSEHHEMALTQSNEITSTVEVSEPVIETATVPVAHIEETVSAPSAELVVEPVSVTAEPTEPLVETKSNNGPAEIRQVESPVSDTGATVGSESTGTVAAAAAAVAVTGAAAAVVGTTAAKQAKTPAGKKPGSASTTTKAPASPAAKPATKDLTKKTESTPRRLPAETNKTALTNGTKPARPTQLSPLKKATPAAPSAAKPATTSAPKTGTTVPAAKKTATDTQNRPPGTVAAAKRVPSAPSSSSAAKATTPVKSASSASTRTATATTAARTATSATPTPRRTPSATTSSATSRSTQPATKPAAATNGDVKPKPTPTARPATKPASAVTKSAAPPKAAPAPKSTVAATKTTAAKPLTNGTAAKAPSTTAKPSSASTTPSRPAPLKSVASRTATPAAKPSASTAAARLTNKTKTAATPPRANKTVTTAATLPPKEEEKAVENKE